MGRAALLVAAASLATIFAFMVVSLGALRGAREATPGSQVIASPQPSRPTVPPGYTTPPGPRLYPTRTADEVLAGMATDASVTGNSPYWDPQSLGTPIFVRALRTSDPDLWLVPDMSVGKVFRVFVVIVDKDGLGYAGMSSGSIPTQDSPALAVPPVSEGRAWEISGAALPDRGGAELVWVNVDPRSGFFVQMELPMWRLSSRSGAVVYVTSSEQLVSAAQVDSLR